MTGLLYRLGRFCGRHHYPVIAVWLVVVVGLAVAANAAGQKTSDNLTLPGTDSTKAQDLLQAKIPAQAYGTNPVVLQAPSGKLTDSKYSQAIASTVSSLEKAPHVTKAVNPLKTKGTPALSKDQTIAYISVTLDEGPADLAEDEAEEIFDAEKPAEDAGLTTATGGYVGQAVSKPDTENSEVIGIAAAIIILIFAFGSVAAMGVPIVSAILGLVSALALIRLLGHVADVPSVAPTLATMIGLGVGIDYALFIVTRHKLQLKDGIETLESIARATATAGGAVFFAGGTVVIALCSMLAADIPLVGTMGYSAAVAVLVAVLAAITLLPALLGALGPRVNSLRVHLGSTHPDDQEPHGWARWARGVAARPWRSMLASVVVLAVLAIPVLNLQLGSTDSGELPESTTARQAYDLMSTGFGPGANGPLLISVDFGDTPAEPEKNGQPASTDPRLQKLEQAIQGTSDVASISPATVTKNGDTAVFTATAKTSPDSTDTEELVTDLRSNVIPGAVKGTSLDVSVGGQTAGYIDLATRISDKLPQMILIVVGLSFIVLLLAFRSILMPLKAAVANLLSVGAAYGVVTFVFQEGHGASLIGLDGAVPIASYVPLLMFAVLFGLSMDYEVFLLTQIQEHHKKHGDTHKAVVEGLASTGRVITSAALIMVCVFSSFVLNGDAVVKQFGVGLAVAIAIDATIVRCLLVPAVMTVLGERCWWIPRWLDRILPRISIEGGDYFDRREAAEARAASDPAAP
ncbi:MAG: MMPL family transporter [Thermoleophilaceae bacterium]